jgi:hypothetical protein
LDANFLPLQAKQRPGGFDRRELAGGLDGAGMRAIGKAWDGRICKGAAVADMQNLGSGKV